MVLILGLTDPIVLLALPILVGLGLFVFILVLTPFAPRLRLLDEPNFRKQHGTSVPMVGGIAIYLVILASMMIVDPPVKLSWLMLSVSILVAVGALDDAFGLGVKTRFAIQTFATVLMILGSSMWIRSLGFGWWGLDSMVGWLGIPLTIFAVVGLTNGFNMVDGIDGLAAGHMLVGLVTLCLTLFVFRGEVHQVAWLTVLMAAVFGFWLVNLSLTPLKKVFLGDAGSLLLGFIMAWTLIYYSQEPIGLMHPVAALWCVTVPVLDTLRVIVGRWKNKRSPFSPDRNHLHHVLVDMGIGSGKVLALIMGLSALLNAIGIWITYSISPLASLILYLTLFAGCIWGPLHSFIEKQLAVRPGLIR